MIWIAFKRFIDFFRARKTSAVDLQTYSQFTKMTVEQYSI